MKEIIVRMRVKCVMVGGILYYVNNYVPGMEYGYYRGYIESGCFNVTDGPYFDRTNQQDYIVRKYDDTMYECFKVYCAQNNISSQTTPLLHVNDVEKILSMLTPELPELIEEAKNVIASKFEFMNSCKTGPEMKLWGDLCYSDD